MQTRLQTSLSSIQHCQHDCRRSELKLIHTDAPDTTKLSCLYLVRFGVVNWIPNNSRLSPTEDLKSEHVSNNCPQFTPLRQTRHRQDCFVVSGWRCKLDISVTIVLLFFVFSGNKSVPIPLAQCRFSGLAISNAKI